MARSLGISLEVSSLIQHMSERQPKDGDTEKPEVLILRHALNMAIGQLPYLPFVREHLPDGTHVNIDVDADATGATVVWTELKLQFGK